MAEQTPTHAALLALVKRLSDLQRVAQLELSKPGTLTPGGFHARNRYTTAFIESEATVLSALRSYAELVSALVYLDKAGASLVPSTVHLRFGTKPETVLFVAKDRGWPGLEEL